MIVLGEQCVMTRARKHHLLWSLTFLLACMAVLGYVWLTDSRTFGFLLIAFFLGLGAVLSFVLSWFDIEPEGYDLTGSMGQMGRGFARGLDMKGDRSPSKHTGSTDRFR